MARMKIKKGRLTQFKGIMDAEMNFFDRMMLLGHNGSYKTTWADGFYWTIADRDYLLKSNPEVHNQNLDVSEPSAEWVLDLNGREVTIRKFQKDARTRKQIDDGAPVRISNQFEVNGVPKSQKDFVAYLEENGIDLDKFLLLSHPEIFTSQKACDCRKILFGMVSDITDKEIADSLPDCEDVGGLLENYSVEEISAMKKREKKEADENLDAIPQQIIGLEKGKVDINVSEFVAQRDTLQAEITALEEQIMAHRKESPEALNKELVLLKNEYDALVAEANSERVAKLTEANEVIGTKRVELEKKEYEKNTHLSSLTHVMEKKKSLESEFEQLSHEYQEWKSAEFDPMSQKCPYCGQNLPVHEIDKLHDKFVADRQKHMDDANKRALEVKRQIHGCEQLIKQTNYAIENIETQLVEWREEIERLSANREQLETVITVDGTDKGKEVLRKIAEVTHRLNQRDEFKAQEEQLYAQKRDKEYAVRELNETIGSVKVNDRIDKQIEELKQKQVEYRQARSNANKILDQLALISMEKNRRLTDAVNSHFEIVKFKLFEQQKNCEYKNCCIPMIRSEDGEYRTFGESANTALMVRAKLDIISGLQKFYDIYVPVILDGAECLDSKNSAMLHMDTQLITLSVSDRPLTVEGE